MSPPATPPRPPPRSARRARRPRGGRRWGSTGRGAHLRRLADLIDETIGALAEIECLDMAMLLESLQKRVISRGARNFRAYADLAEGLPRAHLVLERGTEQPRGTDAGGAGGDHHSLERPVHAGHLEGRPGAWRPATRWC